MSEYKGRLLGDIPGRVGDLIGHEHPHVRMAEYPPLEFGDFENYSPTQMCVEVRDYSITPVYNRYGSVTGTYWVENGHSLHDAIETTLNEVAHLQNFLTEYHLESEYYEYKSGSK